MAPLRILFVVRPGTLLRFALLLPALAERGHSVHIAFMGTPPERAAELARELGERYPSITSGPAPRRPKDDPWRRLAWTIRALGDLAHHAHPRYERAPVLRERLANKVLTRLAKIAGLDPVTRRAALGAARRLAGPTDLRRSRRAIARSRRLEEAMPAGPGIERVIRELAPDVVLATGTFRAGSEETEIVKSARALGIPTGVAAASWDNLTNKGLIKGAPERVFVWNEAQVRECVDLHGVPAEHVRATGAHSFDRWFELSPSRDARQLAIDAGLDPERGYVVYLGSSKNTVGKAEVPFVMRWIEALRASDDERVRGIGVLVRPHPNFDVRWHGRDLGFENAVVWPPAGIHPVGAQARADFFDTLAHSAAVVGINTTAMIEAAILGKSVLTVLVPEFAQETTLHFHYLLAENGGFLHTATSLEEHCSQLRGVLAEDTSGAERRRRFVESFVRPHGLERPAAPILADEIEALAALPVQPRSERGARLLRALLRLELRLGARSVRPTRDRA